MKLLSVALLVALVAAWAWLLRPGFLGGRAHYILVDGVSMQPTYFTGDVVITHRQADYRQGDIVAFAVEGGIVIHRIIGGDGEEGFVMKGDNNPNPDRWRPRKDQIIGRAWLRVPEAGRWLKRLAEPTVLAPLAAGITALSVSTAKARRRVRRWVGRPRSDQQSQPQAWPPGPPWAIAGLSVSLVALAAFAFYTYKALATPAEKTVTSVIGRYAHEGAFEYSVQVQPSTLYPSGVIGPFRAEEDGKPPAAVPPVYTKQASQLNVRYRYTFDSEGAGPVSGAVAADLVVKANQDGGWTKSWPQQPPTSFQGSTANLDLNVDLKALQKTIETIEQETGFQSGSYTVSIVPKVTVETSVGGKEIKEQFAPALTAAWSKSTILVDPASLAKTEAKQVAEPIQIRPRLSLGIAAPAVAAARGIGLALMLAAAAAAASFAGVLLLGIGQNEAMMVRARYGTKVVPVTEFKNGQTEVVRVASLRDLAVLAQSGSKVIFSQKRAGGALYFVPDGLVTYEYAAPASAAEGEPPRRFDRDLGY